MFLSMRESAALDRYITGNYGEDQFKSPRKVSKSYERGAQARRDGKPISFCTYKNLSMLKDWRFGWAEEDMEILASNAESEGGCHE